MKAKILKEEKGIVLVLALLMLLVLTLIGISALNTGTYDILISGNERASVQAFYTAEAGINEFMGRFRTGATNEISDSTDPKTNPTETTPPWKILLAKSSGKGATKIGYGLSAPNTTSIESLQNQLDFGVEVVHKVDANNKLVIVNDFPVYIVKSYGFTADGGNKVIEVEINKFLQDFDKRGALYTETKDVNIQGGKESTYITGMDKCPVDGVYNNKPGVATTMDTISQPGGTPTIDGDPKNPDGYSIAYSVPNLPLREMVAYLKGDANFKYEYNDSMPLWNFNQGTSDNWGTPTAHGTQEPLEYTGTMNIVYFKMEGNTTLKLTGAYGAGILIVDGNLAVEGGFTWYGVVIVTGTFEYFGGAQKNITGVVLAGDSTIIQVEIGGNAGIVNCSNAIIKSKEKIPPLKVTKWREIF